MRRGITPLSIREVEESDSLNSKLSKMPLFRKKVSLDELIVFCRQMYALTKAGIPLIRTMRGLADTTRSPELGEVLDDVTTRLEGGATMATAMLE